MRDKDDYDTGKTGCWCHLAVDMGRHLLTVNPSDNADAQMLRCSDAPECPQHLFADGTYDRLKLMDKAAYFAFVLEIIRRHGDQFHAQKRSTVFPQQVLGPHHHGDTLRTGR